MQVSHGAIQFAVYEELKHAAEGVSLQRFTGSLDRLLGWGGSSSGGGGSSAAGGSSGGRSQGSAGSSSSGGNGSSSSGSRRQHSKVRELTPADITACGALSKLAASVATYPSQVRLLLCCGSKAPAAVCI